MAKTPRPSGAPQNVILAGLPKQQFESLSQYLTYVDLKVKQAIYEPSAKISYAYFVDAGMISVVSNMEDGRTIEIGTIGREGMAGSILLLGVDQVPYQYFVQIAGHAYRISAATLKAECNRNRSLENEANCSANIDFAALSNASRSS